MKVARYFFESKKMYSIRSRETGKRMAFSLLARAKRKQSKQRME
jgi:hypothetical protein